MVADTSALLAILFDEPDAQAIIDRILPHGIRRVSAANLLEAGIKADNHVNPTIGPALDALLVSMGFQVEPVTSDQVKLARDAYRRFGKGNHPAALNYGDCFAYALAKSTGEPLLFKGNDFARTDIVPC
jgi:ribonuclease VapC